MLPYNRKLWARDLTKVSCEWTSERVAASKLENEKFDTKGDKRTPLQADTMVGYPNTGGFQEISQSFVPYLPGLQLGTRVVQIDVKNHAAITEAGKRFEWEFLVSTVPLPILLRMIDQTPREILSCADRLEFLSLRVELLLVGHPLNTPIQRIYVADPRIPAHKIALNHNSSDALRSQPCHAITSEVSVSRQKPVDVDAIAPSTISLLTDLGILDSAEDITWRSHVDVKYAYPVYTHDRPGLVATIQKWLQQYHIYTVGRFGSWEYINSDKCIMKGLTLGRDLRSRYPLQPAATVNRGGY